MRYFRAKVSSRADKPMGTYSYQISSRSVRIQRGGPAGETLSPSYTKWFSSPITVVAWPGKILVESFRKKKIQRSRGYHKLQHGRKGTILVDQFSRYPGPRGFLLYYLFYLEICDAKR